VGAFGCDREERSHVAAHKLVDDRLAFRICEAVVVLVRVVAPVEELARRAGVFVDDELVPIGLE
jgi:hypothetical protein